MNTGNSLLRDSALRLPFGNWLRHARLFQPIAASVAVVLGLGIGGTAHAVIIYSDPADLTITPDQPTHSIQFNLFTGQTELDGVFPGSTIYYDFTNPYTPLMVGQLAAVPNSAIQQYTPNDILSLLPVSELIGPASTLSFDARFFTGTDWSGGGEGIAGFVTSLGNYGWVRVDVETVPGVGISVTLLDFAVETDPGVAISPASTIPESGNVALGFFGTLLGATQSFRWWKVRRAKLPPA